MLPQHSSVVLDTRIKTHPCSSFCVLYSSISSSSSLPAITWSTLVKFEKETKSDLSFTSVFGYAVSYIFPAFQNQNPTHASKLKPSCISVTCIDLFAVDLIQRNYLYTRKKNNKGQEEIGSVPVLTHTHPGN